MKHLTLTQVTGDGTDDNPYRPLGVDQAREWAMVDLRPPASSSGYCFVASDTPLKANRNTFRLGDEANDVSQAARNAVSSAIGVSVESAPIGKMILSLLIEHGRVDGRGWMPLTPNLRAGRYELWMGERLSTRPLIRGGAVSDDFNRANGDIGGAWALATGTQLISASRLRCQGGSALHGTLLASNDAEASVDLMDLTAAPAIGTLVRITIGQPGPGWHVGHIRLGLDTSTGFTARNSYNGRWRDDDGNYEIYRFAGSDFTPPSSATKLAVLRGSRPPVGTRLTTRAQGSAISCLTSTGVNLSVTDTVYPTGVGHGVREGRNVAAYVDNYSAVEL